MRLPRSPYVYFRFAAKPAGEIMIHSGSGKGARADMAAKVKTAQEFAEKTFWPNKPGHNTADRLTSNAFPTRPRTGGMMLSWDGERYVLWTGVTDAELTEISRYASGLLAEGGAA